MTTVFLHIGMPKCASTSVQSYFHHNDEVHRSMGVCYPRSYREESGYFSHRPLHHHTVIDFDVAVNKIVAEAGALGCDKIVLSSEEFLNSLWDQESTAELISALNRKFGEQNVRLVALLRNQVDFVESSYAQFLRAGMFRVNNTEFFNSQNNSLIGFIDWFSERNGFDFFSFRDFLRSFQINAPNNPFDAYSIERADLGDRDIMRVLAERLEIPPPNETQPANERLSSKVLLMLKYARKRYGGELEPRRRNLIQNTFKNSPGGSTPVLDLEGDALERVIISAQKDDEYLTSTFDGCFDCLLQKSVGAKFNRTPQKRLIVRPKERALVDYIICADAISRKNIERVKGELGL